MMVVMVVVMPVTVVVVMVVVTEDPMVVMVMLGAVMMVMILHELHGGVRGLLHGPRRVGRVHCPQHGKRVRDRFKQLGKRPGAGQCRIRALDGGGLRRVERCQAGNCPYQADDFVHLRLLG
jgi:hypothetical protein